MPGADIFIDSTTFLYTLDAAASEKADAAKDWLRALTLRRAGITNLQVLNEVASVLTRMPTRFAQGDPFDRVDVFALFGVTPINSDTALLARALFSRYGYSWWDCLLLASALELGCRHFLSEDLQDGQIIEAPSASQRGGKSLTIVDPFAHSHEQILLSR